MEIPDCYDPAVMEAARALAYTVRVLKGPRCVGCGLPLTSEKFLDLSVFGLKGVACDVCVENNRHWTELMEEDV